MAEVTLEVEFVNSFSQPGGYIQVGGERSSYLCGWPLREGSSNAKRKYVLINKHGGHWVPIGQASYIIMRNETIL